MIPDMADILFLSISTLVIASALWVVLSPNLVHSAVSLLFTLFGVAALYVFLYADFIAAAQVIIYVGGILVLIIFGVMLTNNIEDQNISNKSKNRIPASFFCLFLLYFQISAILDSQWYLGESLIRESTTNDIGMMLLTKYLLPFEIVSILLLAALIGAAMLSRKKV
tara:strand:+ start:255 stop:755 length:501 start_codon:yes stop_codon:yes gene_type:complete